METLLTTLDWVAFATGMIGAPLGLIEIFRPKLADRMENYLDFIGNQDEEGELDRIAVQFSKRFQILIIFAFLLIILLIYSWISTLKDPSPIPQLVISGFWLTVIWVFIGVAFAGILLHFIAIFIQWLDEMTGGHALGGFGVLLIFLGVICDLTDKILDNFLGYG